MKRLVGIILVGILGSPLMTVSTGLPLEAAVTQSCISYIPSAISPNGDGVNDYFQIQFQCEPDQYSMRIYDTDSHLILESKEADQPWDGSIHGTPAPEGRYTWIVSYRLETGRQINKRGQVMLIR